MSTTVLRRAELPADVDRVWQALTDEALLSSWFDGPVRFEPWEGGHASFATPEGCHEGWVELVEPGRRLRWRWWRDGGPGAPAGEATVELRLLPRGATTVLQVVETTVAPAEEPAEGQPTTSPDDAWGTGASPQARAGGPVATVTAPARAVLAAQAPRARDWDARLQALGALVGVEPAG